MSMKHCSAFLCWYLVGTRTQFWLEAYFHPRCCHSRFSLRANLVQIQVPPEEVAPRHGAPDCRDQAFAPEDQVRFLFPGFFSKLLEQHLRLKCFIISFKRRVHRVWSIIITELVNIYGKTEIRLIWCFHPPLDPDTNGPKQVFVTIKRAFLGEGKFWEVRAVVV